MSTITLPSVEQQYPSTDDLLGRVVTIEETDLTLCLRRSRERIAKGHTVTHHISETSFCAIGAVWAEDISLKEFRVLLREVIGSLPSTRVEEHLSTTTKTAIDILNTVAEERHPKARAGALKGRWSGPLEWVNQEWCNKEKKDRLAIIKAEILAIYDEAIDRSLVLESR